MAAQPNIAGMSREDIEAMTIPDVKFILKRIGVLGRATNKAALVDLVDKYKTAATAEGLSKRLPHATKEWLSRLVLRRLKEEAERLGVPNRGVLKEELVDRILEKRDLEHENAEIYVDEEDFWVEKSAFKGAVRIYGVGFFSKTDPLKRLLESKDVVFEVNRRELEIKRGVKFYQVMIIKFERGDGYVAEHPFISKNYEVTAEERIEETVGATIPDLMRKVGKFTRERSGWVVSEIVSHHVPIMRYAPLRGGCYIETSQPLRNSSHERSHKHKEQ